MSAFRIYRLPKKFDRVLLMAALAVLCAAALLLTIDLSVRIWYEMQEPYTWDSPVYWAMGRGILNGLIPYIDLFEIKPPGIFLLSTLSLWLFGNVYLTHILSAVAILLIAIVPVLSLIRRQSFAALPSVCGVLLFWNIGVLIALYAAERSGEFQTELFGAAFISLYVLTARDSSRMQWLRTAIVSVFLLAGIGMKEPFVLTAFASVLLLHGPSPRAIGRTFIVPVCIAGIAGAAIMLSLGWLGPYVLSYLSEMLGIHIYAGGTPWFRGLLVMRLIHDLALYDSWYPTILIILAVIGLVFTAYRRKEREWPKLLLHVVTLICAVLLALYLTSLAVGIGGEYFNHHFVFAVPVYIALALSFGWAVKRWEGHPLHVLLFPISLLILLATLGQPDLHYQERLKFLQASAVPAKLAAVYIDAVLDRCAQSRYLFLGTNGPLPYGYTRHSPLGPLFYQNSGLLDRAHTPFRQQFLGSLSRSTFIVMASHVELNDLFPDVDHVIRTQFSTTPWPCALSLGTGPQDFSYFFRKSA